MKPFASAPESTAVDIDRPPRAGSGRESVPPLLKLGQAARVLGLEERTVRGWLERGTLPHVQPTGTRGGRLIPSHALEEFASGCGLPLDWRTIL